MCKTGAATKVFKYVDHFPKIPELTTEIEIFYKNPPNWKLKLSFPLSETVKFQEHFQVKPINCGQLGNEGRNIKWQCLFGNLPDPSRQFYILNWTFINNLSLIRIFELGKTSQIFYQSFHMRKIKLELMIICCSHPSPRIALFVFCPLPKSTTRPERPKGVKDKVKRPAWLQLEVERILHQN